MRLYFLLPILLFFIGCQTPTSNTVEEVTYQAPKHHSESINAVFSAHGGYEQWSNMKTLSYDRGDERTITNLQNRKIRLETDERVIGFDGTDVWIAPDTLDTERIRFFHNLYFYFFSMPFVVGDDGASYESVPPRILQGKEYYGVKVSYGAGVGDAPDDNYIIWYDPDTFLMEWLMYTVTYRSGEPSDKYSLIRYDDWKEVEGLLLPTFLQWYTYEDTVGEPRGDGARFSNINLAPLPPSDSLFAMPEQAAIAPR